MVRPYPNLWKRPNSPILVSLNFSQMSRQVLHVLAPQTFPRPTFDWSCQMRLRLSCWSRDKSNVLPQFDLKETICWAIFQFAKNLCKLCSQDLNLQVRHSNWFEIQNHICRGHFRRMPDASTFLPCSPFAICQTGQPLHKRMIGPNTYLKTMLVSCASPVRHILSHILTHIHVSIYHDHIKWCGCLTIPLLNHLFGRLQLQKCTNCQEKVYKHDERRWRNRMAP